MRPALGAIRQRVVPAARERTRVHALLGDPSLVKFDLGGIGPGRNGFRTVNLVEGADIRADIIALDEFCHDSSVDLFYMSHTLEHIPLLSLHPFLESLWRKLRPGGVVVVVQTDARKVLALYRRKRIDFYCVRDILFSPRHSRAQSIAETGTDLMQHSFAWGANDLAAEFRLLGFDPVRVFDAGSWPFDVPSALPFEANERYFGRRIPNLGLVASRPSLVTVP